MVRGGIVTWHLFHDWKWDEPRYERTNGYVQTGHCTICGKARVREVLL